MVVVRPFPPSGHCTTETVDLAAAAKKRAAPSESGASRQAKAPKPKARPSVDSGARASTDPPARSNLRPLLTLDEAVDMWLLTLDSIGDTFTDHGPRNRLTLMLAIHRLALGLLAAMGNAVQTACARVEAARAEARADDSLVEVELEPEPDPESDETCWMQLPSPLQLVLQQLQVYLEGRDKTAARHMAEWLLDWMSHRCTNEAAGYFLGHMGGDVALVTSLLVTFAGP